MRAPHYALGLHVRRGGIVAALLNLSGGQTIFRETSATTNRAAAELCDALLTVAGVSRNAMSGAGIAYAPQVEIQHLKFDFSVVSFPDAYAAVPGAGAAAPSTMVLWI